MPVGYANPEMIQYALTLWLCSGLYLTALFMLQAWKMERMDAIDLDRYRHWCDPTPELRMTTAWKVMAVFFAWTPMIQFCAVFGFTLLYLWMGLVMKQNLLALPKKYAQWNRELKSHPSTPSHP